MVELLSRFVRVQRQLLQESGREPTAEEIAAEMEVSPERVGEIRTLGQQPASLDAPLGENGDRLLAATVEDTETVSALESAADTLQGEELAKVLKLLTRRERTVLGLRFGIIGEQPCTLEEVGDRFGVTRERIRQIEAKTLAKLSALRDAQYLRSFLE